MTGGGTQTTVLSTLVEFRASDVAGMTNGVLIGPDVVLSGLDFDSRDLRSGSLFVALVAERDGHVFLADARSRGAKAALVDRHSPEGPETQVVVPDTLAALGRLATAMRAERLADATVVAVTGSVGKTSVKDLTAAVLGADRTWSNPRSFNNDQGLPYTIVNAPADTRTLILEMGMRGFGEITRLCGIAAPDIGVVTRVGEAHTERLGGLEGVARAKGELVEALSPSGTAVLNASDPMVWAMRHRTDASVVGFSGDSDVRASDVVFDDIMCASGVVRTPWGVAPFRLGIPGAHMVDNALAALTVAGVVDGSIDSALARLAVARISDQRMTVHRTSEGSFVVDDTYNANPTSMEAALRALAGMTAARHVAILGPMAEVAEPEAAHRRVAAIASELDVVVIPVATGLYGPDPVDNPIDEVVSRFGFGAEAVGVLVKASRSAGLERIVRELLGT
jgi:UDP-N-acetylmuramoyl-tripeptide--D-alanyl-D-alanine ligase